MEYKLRNSSLPDISDATLSALWAPIYFWGFIAIPVVCCGLPMFFLTTRLFLLNRQEKNTVTFFYIKQSFLLFFFMESILWLINIIYTIFNYNRLFHEIDEGGKATGLAFLLFFVQFLPVMMLLFPVYLYRTAKPELTGNKKRCRALFGFLGLLTYCFLLILLQPV